jgi:transcriptional regulator with XRE-family HTH domain
LVPQRRTGTKRKREIQPTSGAEKAFGLALRKWRQKHEIPQDEFAFRCGFDRTYISLLERGIRSPTLRSIIVLCRELNVCPTVLIREVERALEGETAEKKTQEEET